MLSTQYTATLCAIVLIGLVATSVLAQDYYDEDISPNYENPVSTADQDEITELPGLDTAINFRQFSGYLRADSEKRPRKFFHYWFVESQSNPAKDPVVLWLNGGPGCSSLGGLFTELGPFTVNSDGKTLQLNDYSWNKVANVLFLESPAGVGFSYSNSLLNYHTDDTTARENYLALKSFMEKFPQYKNSSLYLSGESYAGVYLPTLGVLVDADEDLNLKGIAIGNGYLDVAKLRDSLIFFTYYHGLVGKSTWEKVSKYCCEGNAPTRESCAFGGPDSSFRCDFAISEVSSVLSRSGLNPYNLYGKCLSASSTNSSTRSLKPSNKEIVDRHMMSLVFDATLMNEMPFHIFNAAERTLGHEPPCFDDRTLIEYLNSKEVRKAIHIPNKVQSWDTCSMILYVVKYPKLDGGLAPQMKSLISSKRNLAMLVYNGDVDTVCNFLGDEWFVDDLGRDVVKDYSIWKVNNQVAGFVKHYDGITFATIRGSGHMVPGDRPQEALAMIKAFLNAEHGKVLL